GAVDHAAHPHALLGLDADRVDEAAPVGIARPDVHFEQDLAAGERDGIEHRRICERAPEQPADAVTGHHLPRRQAEALQFSGSRSWRRSDPSASSSSWPESRLEKAEYGSASSVISAWPGSTTQRRSARAEPAASINARGSATAMRT